VDRVVLLIALRERHEQGVCVCGWVWVWVWVWVRECVKGLGVTASYFSSRSERVTNAFTRSPRT